MEEIEIDNIFELIRTSRFVGLGTTAIVFLTKNNCVLKIYINTHGKRSLFKYNEDMFKHMKDIYTVNNHSFIGPEKLLVSKNEMIGYTMPYVKGRTLKRINSDIKISELKQSIEILSNNTKLISDKGFKLMDLHNKNILVSNKEFFVIDLDRGTFMDLESEKLLNINMKSLNYQIISAIFMADYCHSIHFYDSALCNLYRDSVHDYYKYIYDLLDEFSKRTGKDDPTIKQIRRCRRINPTLERQFPY